MIGAGIDPGVLPAFVLAMALIELTPGPNLAYLALLGATRGRGVGLRAVFGITLGLCVWLIVALFGLTWTSLYSRSGLEALRWVGAAYLLWLAVDALRSGAGTAKPRDAGEGRPFWRGFAANILNPKAAIFYLALLPSFIKPAVGPVAVQVLILGGIHIAISVAIHSAAVFGAAETAARLPTSWLLGFRLVLAAGLVASAIWMLTIPLSLGPQT